jgi:hypothetical protein
VISISEVRKDIDINSKYWLIPFMEFVDSFRKHKDITSLSVPFNKKNDRFDAIVASMVEYLCAELELEPPQWIVDIPGCKEPWFVSGIENLKAIALAESPIYFRRRKIFVLENFLDRV